MQFKCISSAARAVSIQSGINVLDESGGGGMARYMSARTEKRLILSERTKKFSIAVRLWFSDRMRCFALGFSWFLSF